MRGLLNFAQALETHARLSPTKIGAGDLDRGMSYALWNRRAEAVGRRQSSACEAPAAKPVRPGLGGLGLD